MENSIIHLSDIVLKSESDKQLMIRDAEILTNKILNKRDTNIQTFAKIVEDEDNLIDAIAYFKDIIFNVVDKNLIANITIGEIIYPCTINKNAISQFINKFKINAIHVSNLLDSKTNWGADIIAYTFNGYVNNTRNTDKCLVRIVKQNNIYELRAVLSDTFHRYSTSSIYKNVLTKLKNNSIVLNTQYDGLNSYLEVVSTTLKSFYIKDKLVNTVFGLQIKNSSFGTSALDIKPFTHTVICGNGLTNKSVFRSIHRADKQQVFGLLSNETLQLEAHLFESRITDAINFIFNDKTINDNIEALSTLGEQSITADELKKLPSIGLNKKEVDEVIDIILNGSANDGLLGNNSAYDVVQAISKVSQTKSLVREKELQDICGDFIISVRNIKK